MKRGSGFLKNDRDKKDFSESILYISGKRRGRNCPAFFYLAEAFFIESIIIS